MDFIHTSIEYSQLGILSVPSLLSISSPFNHKVVLLLNQPWPSQDLLPLFWATFLFSNIVVEMLYNSNLFDCFTKSFLASSPIIIGIVKT